MPRRWHVDCLLPKRISLVPDDVSEFGEIGGFRGLPFLAVVVLFCGFWGALQRLRLRDFVATVRSDRGWVLDALGLAPTRCARVGTASSAADVPWPFARRAPGALRAVPSRVQPDVQLVLSLKRLEH